MINYYQIMGVAILLIHVAQVKRLVFLNSYTIAEL